MPKPPTTEKTLEERAYEFFTKLMGDELKVLERLAPSPLPEIIAAFVAWLEKEIKKEMPAPQHVPQPLPPTGWPSPYPLPVPTVPEPKPFKPWGEEPWHRERWTCLEKWTSQAREWAEVQGVQYTSDADLVAKYAVSQSQKE